MTAQARPVFGLGVTLDGMRFERAAYRTIYRNLPDVRGAVSLCVLPPLLTDNSEVLGSHFCAYCLGRGKVIGGDTCTACRGVGLVHVCFELCSIMPWSLPPEGVRDEAQSPYKTLGGPWYVAPASDAFMTPCAPWWPPVAGEGTLPPAGMVYGFDGVLFALGGVL